METSNYNTAGETGPYAVDMSNISIPKNIRTEKELEQEVTKICDTLKDTRNYIALFMKLSYNEIC